MAALPIVALAMLASLQDPVMDYGQARAFVRAGETDSLGAVPPIAAVAFEHDMLLKYAVISFHRRSLPEAGQTERRPIWFARLRSTHHVDVVVRYADARTC